jgi:hypothetical protein
VRNKKSQVTVFIIVGIIVLLIFALAMYISKSNDKSVDNEIQTMKTPLEFQPIKNYVEQCIESRTQDVIRVVALQGGYYGISNYPLEYVVPGLDVSIYLPYYLYDFENTVIDKSRLEQELSYGIESSLESCMNFSMFHYDISVDTKALDVQTSLTTNNVIAKVFFTLNIQSEDAINTIDQFDVQVQTDLLNVYNVAKLITDEQYINGNEICITCLSDIVNSIGYNLDMVEVEGDSYYVIIYTISDSNSDIVYNFAHRFNLDDGYNALNIESIDTLNAVIDYKFNYIILATGNNLTFSDDSDLFNIDSKSGLIEFTPKYINSGEHIITITVEDFNGNKVTEIFTLIIEDFGSKPVIDYIGNLEGRVGESFLYDVNASSTDDLYLTYVDDSDLFDVNLKTGIIDFIPSEVGVFSFDITAIDQNGNYDVEGGLLVVN